VLLLTLPASSLHTILLGVGAPPTAFYSLAAENLGLDPQEATKLAVKLHAHSVQYACILVSTRLLLESQRCTIERMNIYKVTSCT